MEVRHVAQIQARLAAVDTLAKCRSHKYGGKFCNFEPVLERRFQWSLQSVAGGSTFEEESFTKKPS